MSLKSRILLWQQPLNRFRIPNVATRATRQSRNMRRERHTLDCFSATLETHLLERPLAFTLSRQRSGLVEPNVELHTRELGSHVSKTRRDECDFAKDRNSSAALRN